MNRSEDPEREAQGFKFFSLPPEIRDMIYEASQRETPVKTVRFSRARGQGWQSSNNFEPALRLVNRRLSSEATAVFYKTTVFHFNFNDNIETPTQQSTCSQMKYILRLVITIIPGSLWEWLLRSKTPYPQFEDYRSTLEQCEVNIQKEVLPLLHAMPNLRQLDIQIKAMLVLKTYDEDHLWLRLEGLKAIKGLKRVRICGQIERKWAKELQQSMESPVESSSSDLVISRG